MTPKTRQETFLHAMSQGAPTPEPITRTEQYYKAIADTMTDGTIKESLSVTANGRYIAPEGTLYTDVVVNVPLIEETFRKNGTYVARPDMTGGFSRVVVAVEGDDAMLTMVIDDTIEEIHASTFPANKNYVREYCFAGMEHLRSVELPSEIISINFEAFRDCLALVDINLENVVLIRGGVFRNCTELESVRLESIERIEQSAFYGCSRLSSMTITTTTPPTLGISAFDRTSNDLVIYVPAEAVNTYKAADGWSSYADRIQAITE